MVFRDENGAFPPLIVRVSQRLKRERDQARRERDQQRVQVAAYETLLGALLDEVATLRSKSRE
jgi:hypothetical protein